MIYYEKISNRAKKDYVFAIQTKRLEYGFEQGLSQMREYWIDDPIENKVKNTINNFSRK